jgi:cation diffusion facilitator family transporter
VSAKGHGHGHGHTHASQHHHGGVLSRIRHLFVPHSHDTADRIDATMKASAEGMRALWISLAVLGATAATQAVVVVFSGSVALLSDTLHNVADALTAVPVGIAFLLGRRLATRRFTYGFGRAEDVAGIVVVLAIAGSALAAAIESIRRFTEPTDIRQLPVVAVAALVGFLGNEIAARVRIRTGRRIGSAVLVADGLHARADSITSLAVLLSVLGAAFGLRWADPAIGLVISVAIMIVTYSAAKQVVTRLMDAVDPALVDQAKAVLRDTEGVEAIDKIRMRWIGHALHAEVDLAVGAELTLRDAHTVAHRAEHRLRESIARMSSATVHVHPNGAHPQPAPV